MATKKKASGPSGKNLGTPILLRATSAEQKAIWEAAAKSHGLTLSAWLRLAADHQAKRKTLG